MRVFVAGASGAIGASLVPRLAAAGHEVTAMTRSAGKAGDLEAAGARPVVCDAFDASAVRDAVDAAGAEVVVNELTALPNHFDPRKVDYGPTNRLRREGTANLLAAAAAAGARRLISQSIAFLYAPEGPPLKDEEDPPFIDAPEPFGDGIQATLELERQTLSAPSVEGVVLRYGWFYGPGTYFAPDGSIAERVRARRYPVIGSGHGITSFLHVDDAAAATVAALDHGPAGIYNVVDEAPAALREWLPEYARALGAKAPLRVPRWLARLVGGRMMAVMATEQRGASNAKAKRELGWSLRYPSWRQGFREGLG